MQFPPVIADAISESKPTVKLGYVNALRGLAILGVILVHNGEHDPNFKSFPKLFQTFIDQGSRGVQLFFVISAFTLFLSMSKRKQERHPTRNFFIRRFFRIAPMYYIGITFYTFWFTTVQMRSVSITNILANITFMHGVSPYWINSLVPGGWSITVEMWFYCLAPLLFNKLKSVDQAVRFIAFSMLVSCILSILLSPIHVISESWRWASFLFLYFPSQLPVFGFGILLHLLLVNSEHPKNVRASTLQLTASIVLLILMTKMGTDGQILLGIAEAGQHYWFGAAFLLLAFGLSRHAPWFIVNPIIMYIGEVSFSLYLVHFAVLFVLERTGHTEFFHGSRLVIFLIDFGSRYLFVLAVSVVLATVFYRLVEVPLQNLGKRLINVLEK